MAEPYSSVYFQPGETPVFCYRTGFTVYEESLYKGVPVASGWNTAGYPLNVLSNCPTRLSPHAFDAPAVFGAVLNGRALEYDLTMEDFTEETDANGTKAVLTLKSAALPVTVRIITLLDGTAMFTRCLEIENRGAEPLCLSKLTLLGGGVEQMDRFPLTRENNVEKLYSLGYFEGETWGYEGCFRWRDLAPGVFSVDIRFGADRYRHPLCFLRNNITGDLWFYQIAYSGGCRFSAELHASPEQSESRLGFSAEITGYAPLAVIKPGDTFVSPQVHAGAVHGDPDTAVNEMHAHIRKSVLNLPEADPSACLVGAGMGAEHDMSVETTKAFMRQMKEMGAEVFIIDAGWVCPPTEGGIDWGGYNGLNVPHPDRYPNGIAEVSDYCRSLGMKFALWVEIERLGKLCPLHNEKPEWRAKDIYGERDGGFIDLTNPETAAWAENELARIITEYKLDLLRVDYNVSHNSYFHFTDTGAGIPECMALRQFEAVYKMYGNLKKKFPHVIFENCAGGGGRTDLGQMKAFHHTWVSDWQKLPRAALITNGMTMALPPERVDRLFAGMGSHPFGSLDAQMRNTMLTHMSLNVVAPAATEWNPAQMAFIKHSVGLYKSFIRPFLPSCRVYHHTPEAAKALEEGKMILEIASPDGKKGAVGIFTLTNSPGAELCVRPRGIRADLIYRVTADNSGAVCEVKGYELLAAGFPARIPAALGSELLLYEAIE